MRRSACKAGAGSRLTALQAQQTLSTDQVLVETFELALFRAQEALGVLVTSDRPLDAVDEPAFEIPEEASTLAAADQEIQQRADIKFSNLQIFAAKRVVDDSWKDWMPTVNGVFQPAFQQPGFDRVAENGAGARFCCSTSRSSTRASGAASRWCARPRCGKTKRRSEARSGRPSRRSALAYEAVRRSARALESARAAAQQSAEVLNITTFSFRAGATTNIEVIDAQRRARDSDTAVAVAEDAVRQARLDLLTALGRFPR